MAHGMSLGTSGVAGLTTEAAIGVGTARGLGRIPAAAVRAGDAIAAPTLALLTPAQAAEQLGVAESDVIARLEAGYLKGKKIGTQYRIPRQAIDDFLNA